MCCVAPISFPLLHRLLSLCDQCCVSRRVLSHDSSAVRRVPGIRYKKKLRCIDVVHELCPVLFSTYCALYREVYQSGSWDNDDVHGRSLSNLFMRGLAICASARNEWHGLGCFGFVSRITPVPRGNLAILFTNAGHFIVVA